MAPVQETFTEALEFTSEFTPRAFPNLTKHLDPTWVEEALLATGTATLRKRRLPAEQTVWLLLGMVVLRDLPITAVARQLDVALPAADGTRTVASSALTQARSRLGPEPMEWLFLRTSEEWAHRSAGADRWRDSPCMGSTARHCASRTARKIASTSAAKKPDATRAVARCGKADIPSLRLVVVMALRSHLLASAVFGPYATDERTYAASLWATVPDHSLVLVDRHYLQANVLVPLMTQGTERNWMTRAKATTKFRLIRRLGPGDDLVEFEVSREARRKDPSLPTHFDARAIKYQRKGYKPQLLLTSLVDPERYPANELRALYHERWEIELGFGELKTDMLERLETIRSKAPATVAQEMWGLLIAYNLIRLEMQRIAAEFEVAPTRISFVASLRHCVEQWHFATMASPGTILGRLATATDRMRTFVLPPRRTERVFPREVKIKMSNYGRKLPKSSSGKGAK